MRALQTELCPGEIEHISCIRALARYLPNPSITPGHAVYGTMYAQCSCTNSTLWYRLAWYLRRRVRNWCFACALCCILHHQLAVILDAWLAPSRRTAAIVKFQQFSLFLSSLGFKKKHLFSNCNHVSPRYYSLSTLEHHVARSAVSLLIIGPVLFQRSRERHMYAYIAYANSCAAPYEKEAYRSGRI